MIGGALGEARGDLMPGFVDAALKTPYKLRVPLAPAEGLVLESQVRAGTCSAGQGCLSSGRVSTRPFLPQDVRKDSPRSTDAYPGATQGFRKGYAWITLRGYAKVIVKER